MAEEDDDPVVLRVPVYLKSEDPERPVCLFQYPLRPRWRPYNLDELRSARARPQQRHFELNVGAECSPAHHDTDSDSPLTSISLTSRGSSAKTSYAIGMMHVDKDGTPEALCLTPLDAAVQLRPSFAQIDADEGTAAGAGSSTGNSAAASPARPKHRRAVVLDDEDEPMDDEDDDEEDEEGAAGSAIALQFRPAQTEREIEARRSSHAFLVEQREAEPWSDATLHAADSDASHAVRESIFPRPR
jgi:DNA-directed RNA polymerase-3 subunit RPC5